MLVSSEFKPKSNKCSFEEIFIKYANKHPGFWYMHDHMPSLKEARGKIVLLRRFFAHYTPMGLDMKGWKNNMTFQIKNNFDFEFHIQDEYKKQTTQKWHPIVQHIDKALSDTDDKQIWYLNYSSAHKLPLVPVVIANTINRKLMVHLRTIESSNRLGTIILDFADESIIKFIYLLNFKS